MAGFDLPVRAIREQIASAIDIVVHISRMRDGAKVVASAKSSGMEGDIVTMQEIVRYLQRGVDENNKVVGEFAYTGMQPNCLSASRSTESRTIPRAQQLELMTPYGRGFRAYAIFVGVAAPSG